MSGLWIGECGERFEVLTECSSPRGGKGDPDAASPAASCATLSDIPGVCECGELLTQRGVGGSQEVAQRGELFLGYGVEERTDSQARDRVNHRVECG